MISLETQMLTSFHNMGLISRTMYGRLAGPFDGICECHVYVNHVVKIVIKCSQLVLRCNYGLSLMLDMGSLRTCLVVYE